MILVVISLGGKLPPCPPPSRWNPAGSQTQGSVLHDKWSISFLTITPSSMEGQKRSIRQTYHPSGGVGQDHVHHPCVWRNAKSFYCFLPWEKAGLRFQCILKSIHHEKTTNELLVSLYTLLCACTKQLCRWLCSLTKNVSECWLSTLLKCLASGKKSIEQLHPSAPRQTSALELLEVYSFRILLVYRCALYYGMLILSCALGACPTPLGVSMNKLHAVLPPRTEWDIKSCWVSMTSQWL